MATAKVLRDCRNEGEFMRLAMESGTPNAIRGTDALIGSRQVPAANGKSGFGAARYEQGKRDALEAKRNRLRKMRKALARGQGRLAK